jgi:hypothetical protein
MNKKMSIINIQDLGLSTASQHSVDGQPILRGIFRKFFIFLERKFLFLESFSGYWRVADVLNESL